MANKIALICMIESQFPKSSFSAIKLAKGVCGERVIEED